MNKIVECGRRIYGCISTYDSLLTRGSVVISIVENL